MNDSLLHVKRVCLDIERRDGVVTPPAVVAEAASPRSPIHHLFEWDDTKAAREYRLKQARGLIREVRVEYLGKKVHGFQNVKIQLPEKIQRGYVSIGRIMNEKDLRVQAISDALSRIRYWLDRYEEYQELSGVVNEDKLEELLSRYKK